MTKLSGHFSRAQRYALASACCVLAIGIVLGIKAQNAADDPWAVKTSPDMPKYKWDPTWPKPLPNKWKLGGITGLAVDKDDNVWVLNRPNDLTSIEIEAELEPPVDRKSVV